MLKCQLRELQDLNKIVNTKHGLRLSVVMNIYVPMFLSKQYGLEPD